MDNELVAVASKEIDEQDKDLPAVKRAESEAELTELDVLTIALRTITQRYDEKMDVINRQAALIKELQQENKQLKEARPQKRKREQKYKCAYCSMEYVRITEDPIMYCDRCSKCNTCDSIDGCIMCTTVGCRCRKCIIPSPLLIQ